MTITYDRGSLVLDEVVPTASLRVGDVITYLPPRGVGPGHLVTHRIAAIAHGPRGERVYHTKGDANPTPDPWTFTLPKPRQARVRVGVPYVGFLLAALAVAAALAPAGLRSSGASFTATSANPAEAFAAAADFNTVAVSLTDPGTPLRGSVALSATASSGRGIASVTFQAAPTGTSSWSTVCSATSSPYSCSFDTAAVADGVIDVRAV